MKHPITLPSKLLQEWMFELHFQVPHPDYGPMNSQPHWEELIERVAQWAADEQLKVVEQGIIDQGWFANPKHRLAQLRAACRPKPPSLKKQALEDLEQIDGYAVDQLSAYEIHGDLKLRVSNIRRALESLPND